MAGFETAPAIVPPPLPVRSERDEVERRIEERIHRVGRRIGWVELSWRVLIWLVGVVGFLLVFTVCDQWLFSRGMPPLVRWVSWGVLTGLSVVWITVVLGPYLLHRIHPLFAAYVLEEAVPDLKHALLGFLLLRNQREDFEHDPLSRHVFQGLEKTAAATVEVVPLDLVVDRSQIVRWAAVLAGILAAFCLYFVLSPKNALVSTARVLLPWADIPPATRVRIETVSPGSAEVMMGDRVEVQATIVGLRNGERPHVQFSTADGQFVNQLIPMAQTNDDATRFSAVLSDAIHQDATYRIQAADAETKEFRVRVLPAIRMELQAVELEFPAYTRLGRRTQNGQGDISAIEGSRATIVGRASVPLASAEIELNGGRARKAMRKAGEFWRGELTLKMSNKDPNVGEFTSYTLRGTDENGRSNRDPVRFTIVTIRDQPPSVRFDDPPPDGAIIPVNGSTALKATAQDPDFGLRRLTGNVEKDGRTIVSSVLFELPPDKPGSTQAVTKSFEIRPEALKLRPGDSIICWLEAVDNREPTGNRTESQRLKLVIGEAAPSDAATAQKPQEDNGQDTSKDRTPQNASDPSEHGQQGTKDSSPQGEQGQGSPASNQPDNPASTDAMPADGDSRQGPRDGNAEGAQARDQGEQNGTQGGTPQAMQGEQTQKGQPEQNAPSGDANGEDTQGSGQSQDKPAGERSQEAKTNGDGSQGSSQPGTGGESGEKNQSPTASNYNSAGNTGGQEQDNAGGVSQGASSGDQGRGTGKPSPGSSAGSQGRSQGEGERNGGSTETGHEGSGTPDGNAGQSTGSQTARPSVSTPSGSITPNGTEGGTPDDGRGSNNTSQPGQSENSSQHGGVTHPDSPADGINDPGEAFERILDYLREKGHAKPSERSNSSKEESETTKEQSQEGAGAADRTSTNAPAQSSGSGQDSPQGRHGDTAAGSPKQSEGGQDDATGKNITAGNSATGAENQTGNPSPNQDPRTPMGGPTPSDGNGREHGGEAGSSPQDMADQNAPPGKDGSNAETPPQSREPSAADGPEGSTTEPQSSTDPTLRDSSQSQGENPGPLPGGGREGQGQSSPQTGYGAPGSQSEASDGGQAVRDTTGPESTMANGKGASSAASGDQRQDATPGPGQAQQSTEQGNSSSTGRRATGGGNPRGGGLPSESGPTTPHKPQQPDAADDPVVEFAQQQTDLALRYLEEELAKNSPDPGLLQRLGWTRADMERFTQRWRELRERLNDPAIDPASAQQISEVLKSLGLRPAGTELRAGRGSKDAQRGLGTIRQTSPPPQWSEQYREYLKALGRSE